METPKFVKQVLPAFILAFLFLFASPIQAVSPTEVDLFQITDTPLQENAPLIYKDLVVYRRHEADLNIYGYDLDDRKEFQLVNKPKDQFPTSLYKDYLLYDDYVDSSIDYSDVRILNIKTHKNVLIAGGPGNQSSGVTNGKQVAYIDGAGVCGKVMVYDLQKKYRKEISPTGCWPVRISDNIVVWGYAAPGGSDIYGYDLQKKEGFIITNDDGMQEAPNIYRNTVVWYHYIGGGFGDYQAIVMKNLKTGQKKTIYETITESLNWPAISNKYIVWSQAPSLHVGSVMGFNLKTGEVFEVQKPGNHQNSHTAPVIWDDVIVWQAWRTGNGDIYGAEFD